MGALVTDDGWIRAFERREGPNWDYRAGRTVGSFVAVHITAGNDSSGITPRVCTGLIRKQGQGPHLQHAPLRAVTFHACEHNHFGAGWETEKLTVDQPTDDHQIWGWAMVIAAHREIGAPSGWGYHGGTPHDVWPPGNYPAPYCSHGSLQQHACDQHYDFISDEDMARAYALSLTLDGSAPNRTTEDNDVIWSCSAGRLNGRDWATDGKACLELSDGQYQKAVARGATVIEDCTTDQIQWVLHFYGLKA